MAPPAGGGGGKAEREARQEQHLAKLRADLEARIAAHEEEKAASAMAANQSHSLVINAQLELDRVPDVDAVHVQQDVLQMVPFVPLDNDAVRLDAPVAMLWCADLDRVLDMPLPLFWSHILHSPSLMTFLDSYLRHRDRPVADLLVDDDDHGSSLPSGGGAGGSSGGSSSTAAVVDVHAGGVGGPVTTALDAKVLAVFVRMSTTSEDARNFLDEKWHADMLYEHFLFDVAKMLDICVLFGAAAREVVHGILSRVFGVQPKYWHDLGESIVTIRQSLEEAAAALPKARGHAACADLSRFALDVCFAVDSLLSCFPEASGALESSQHRFLETALSRFYEDVLLSLHVRVLGLGRAGDDGKMARGNHVDPSQPPPARLDRELRAAKFLALHAASLLMQTHYVNTDLGDAHVSELLALLNAVHAYASADHSKHGHSFLGDLVLVFPLREIMARLKRDHGVDPDQCQYIIDTLDALNRMQQEAAAHAHEAAMQEQNKNKNKNTSSSSNNNKQQQEQSHGASGASGAGSSSMTTSSGGVPDDQIMMVTALFPEYDRGFVALCIESFSGNVELVINHILEGSLPSPLCDMDPTAPPPKQEHQQQQQGKAMQAHSAPAAATATATGATPHASVSDSGAAGNATSSSSSTAAAKDKEKEDRKGKAKAVAPVISTLESAPREVQEMLSPAPAADAWGGYGAPINAAARTVFDGDEFDINAVDYIPADRVQQGKKRVGKRAQQAFLDERDDDLRTRTMELFMYEDEYNDAFDENMEFAIGDEGDDFVENLTPKQRAAREDNAPKGGGTLVDAPSQQDKQTAQQAGQQSGQGRGGRGGHNNNGNNNGNNNNNNNNNSGGSGGAGRGQRGPRGKGRGGAKGASGRRAPQTAASARRKEANKASIGNHNRKAGAQKKMNRAMGGAAGPSPFA